MSKLVAFAAIQGGYNIVQKAEGKYKRAMEKYGPEQKLEFPNTAYYLPIIYSILGIPIKTLGDAAEVIKICRSLLPPHIKRVNHLPYLGPMLDAGMAAILAEEIVEAIRYVEDPDFYQPEIEDPDIDNGKIWLGAADDAIMRKRGVEFVDGTAPGFAAIVGAAPDPETAKMIAEEYQKKSIYVFMAANQAGTTFAEQLLEAGVQIGWNARLVPFGPDISAAVFALGFANRAAMSFGGVKPGDSRKILMYNKDRIFAFVNALGEVNAEWAANAAGCVNWGFPTIADTDIPEVLPTGICTYEHVVANVSHEDMTNKSIEIRGLKVTVSEIDIPLAYGPAFEGERVRKDDLYLEMGGGKTQAVELCKMADMKEIEDGQVNVIGPEIKDTKKGDKLPLGIFVQAAGRKMQEDFEPILERQIHHLINYAQGVMHIGQRDIAWIRVGDQAVNKGFTLKDIGVILHAKLHQDFGAILDKVQVTLYAKKDDVDKLTATARGNYKKRDARVEQMTDEGVETYYSCTLCQSFAPNHVCMVSPERTGLCGAYNWMDCKASNEINPTGPNQPVEKGECIDPKLGQWKGVNDFVYKASRQQVTHYNFYSIVHDPMTTCGCCECIAAVISACNGVMTVSRDYTGETPSGMKFTTLAGVMGGGAASPGFVGHSKYNICQRKFISGDGGLLRMVWMPKGLKEELREGLLKRGEELGCPDLIDRIADETVGVTEDEILPFLKEKDHPALKMDPIIG
ncbi:MAG: CO dehydrogenase/CO-methylating acetyl-CoA synthase complex subunit beta [Deltaproteobacteria bacterium CG12_big_fil_rev_8_21_14_0_65_43_10]|nr:MAG: CO dehydrogenase/CO-methylating acetyl-CoA synthase complex subunit beta [Deltaproteobacteria bacterium CG2_30_43_15]PIQ46223.1 MAG: CO dehydrogenase/CO-methylating acetyl-CoA synthase complex subunit beta [Deltaproteobacteria bacterium CG12_big_fil_rev_8_21_14_0_65_43_10]PIX22910.1 MAG: CO dehydrogenase/CO-methylating acetyl-CoA synthase complex subunit beta [Deltaproteobacteria bacterium CG_4_8_14_3_um_filter_43_13]PIZ19016.1 MAG: CO dehydrogenase/CO-methylating acetyl-CoA synthase com